MHPAGWGTGPTSRQPKIISWNLQKQTLSGPTLCLFALMHLLARIDHPPGPAALRKGQFSSFAILKAEIKSFAVTLTSA